MYNISLVVIISDAAKLENTAEDNTVYTCLECAVNLTVKFHINPVNSYRSCWSMGSSNDLQDSNVNNTVKGNHVKTTYFIPNVTKKQLGNYTVRVINSAITSEHNEAIFNVLLKLKGKKSKAMSCFTLYIWQPDVRGLHIF